MTKTEIIQAAFKVWGREFYQNTSLSRLMEELGTSKPALYRHFRNKEALMDAMAARFFDDFADCIRSGYEQAIHLKNRTEGVAAMLHSTAEYYARNVYGLIFSLINVYDRDNAEFAAAEELRRRGIDMEAFHRIIREDYSGCALLMPLVFATLTFFMAHFHKTGKTFIDTPSDEAVRKIIAMVNEIITHGLGYSNDTKAITGLNYAKLESQVAGSVQNVEEDPLLKAVAEAVAEAGPWDASMEMVARRSGLSKSSLYGHFKSKQDMLSQLFMTEFRRIIAFARDSIKRSAVPVEQLYLGIFSVVLYLRSKPDILTAMDWIRTRKLDLGPPEQDMDFFVVFKDIRAGRLKNGESSGENENQQLSHWILFLIISILMRRHKAQSLTDMPNSDVRTLYRFITLGMEGFKKK
jgi:AcrR family transcriptional regulator